METGMRSRFDPLQHNLTANPALAKTNSPVRVFVGLVLGLVLITAALLVIREPRISRPRIRIEGNQVIAMSEVENGTSDPVRLTLEFVIGDVRPGARSGTARLGEVARRQVEVTVAPYAKRDVECEFTVNGLQPYRDLGARVQVLRKD